MLAEMVRQQGLILQVLVVGQWVPLCLLVAWLHCVLLPESWGLEHDFTCMMVIT